MLITNTICAVLTLILSLWVIAAVTMLTRGHVSGMARIYLSEILQNIKGSIGNHVYSCWKGLNYLRNKAVSISNPRSEQQALIRARTAATSRRWYLMLSVAQRSLWDEWAQQQGSAAKQTGPNSNGGAGTKSLIPGNGGVMSGFNSFIMINGLAYTGGVTAFGVFLDDAPLTFPKPVAPSALTCVWNAVTCCIDLAWTDPDPALPDTRVRVWLVSLDAGVHKQLIASVALAAEAYAVCSVRTALGASNLINALPGHYHIQVDAIGPDGQKSPPSNICQTAVPSGCVPV